MMIIPLPYYISFATSFVRSEKCVGVRYFAIRNQCTLVQPCKSVYTGCPPPPQKKKKKKKKNRNGGYSRYSRFSRLCSDQQLSFFTLLDRASFPHYCNTKIINLVENFLFYEWFLMDCHFRDLPDFQSSEARLMTASAASTCWRQHSTSYKGISVPMTCLDCKSLLGNTWIYWTQNSQFLDGRSCH